MIGFYKDILRSENPDHIIPDDFCCKLLAMLYCYTIEESVYSQRMKAEIKQAAFQMGFYGGGSPKNAEKIKRYVVEIQSGKAEWIGELEDRYALHLNNEMMEKTVYPRMNCGAKTDLEVSE